MNLKKIEWYDLPIDRTNGKRLLVGSMDRQLWKGTLPNGEEVFIGSDRNETGIFANRTTTYTAKKANGDQVAIEKTLQLIKKRLINIPIKVEMNWSVEKATREGWVRVAMVADETDASNITEYLHLSKGVAHRAVKLEKGK